MDMGRCGSLLATGALTVIPASDTSQMGLSTLTLSSSPLLPTTIMPSWSLRLLET